MLYKDQVLGWGRGSVGRVLVQHNWLWVPHTHIQLAMVVNTSNPSTWKVELENSKFNVSLRYKVSSRAACAIRDPGRRGNHALLYLT